MDQDEALPKAEIIIRKKPAVAPRIKSADTYRSLTVLNKVDERYKEYEILFNIENEDQIKVPKGN